MIDKEKLTELCSEADRLEAELARLRTMQQDLQKQERRFLANTDPDNETQMGILAGIKLKLLVVPGKIDLLGEQRDAVCEELRVEIPRVAAQLRKDVGAYKRWLIRQSEDDFAELTGDPALKFPIMAEIAANDDPLPTAIERCLQDTKVHSATWPHATARSLLNQLLAWEARTAGLPLHAGAVVEPEQPASASEAPPAAVGTRELKLRPASRAKSASPAAAKMPDEFETSGEGADD